MKLTIEGSALANHLKPLATPVRQHEGRDYDKLAMSIDEVDGKKYLKACIEQPSYSAFLNLNLSGETALTQNGNEPPLGAEPIDANAVACGAKEMYKMKATDMVNINRNVGNYEGIYLITDGVLEVSMTDYALLRKPCKHVLERLEIPRLYEKELTAEQSLNALNYRLMGSIGENSGFCEALEATIRICRLSHSKGVLKTQAIHLCLSAERLRIEAVSANGAVVYDVKHDVHAFCMDDMPAERHLAISLPAAETLCRMCAASKDTIYWSYRADDKSLCIMSKPYTIIIMTEDVAGCVLPPFEGEFDAVTVDCTKLHHVLQRVKTSGSPTVYLGIMHEGVIDVYTSDKSVEDVVDVLSRDIRSLDDFRTLMPVDTLLAALRAFQDKHITLSYGCQHRFMVLTSNDNVSAMVYRL